MTDTLYKLPGLLILGLLVMFFCSLNRPNFSSRFRLWSFAWILIFVHSCVAVAGSQPELSSPALITVGSIALQAAGIMFLVSVSAVFHDPRLRIPLFLTLAVPILTLAVLSGLSVSLPFVYGICVLATAGGAISWILYMQWAKLNSFFLIGMVAIAIVAITIAILVWRGRTQLGLYAVATAIYACTGLFFFLTFRRPSPGVISSSFGFLIWASTFPAYYAMASRPALLAVANEFFSVPKFLVALGMIVTILEEESVAIRSGRERERVFRIQLQKFADVTSRLLSGVEVGSYSQHIARVITEASNFQRVCILLITEEQQFYVAGHSGIPESLLKELNSGMPQMSAEAVANACRPEKRVGQNSFRAGFCSMIGQYGEPRTLGENELVIPLHSSHLAVLGCILLAEPRSASAVTAEDLSALEMLGADLAVAMENTNLQRQLIRSEKLAGVGQLVSGVAHELNNPLTAVLGYAEMLQDRTNEEGSKRDLDVIRREALRMKKIIDNLLRFSRQGKSERKPMELASIVDDVMKLRAYELRSKRIELQLDIPPDLPKIMVDENLMKQVFINVLNNAFEAVEGLPHKRLKISATSLGEKVQIRVSDNGRGFVHLHRVFDPFFTTKGLGKGPGLGLSICYGIVKEHGGEISAVNLVPAGACIVIDLPTAVTKAEKDSTASAVH